jgi:prepilin-type N-terminal cleavage/methylation domain-containing protein
MMAFRNRNGFTVIELLVVLTIVALITGAGLAVLSHSGRQFGFQSMRGELVSMIRYARSNAITEKGVSAVVINGPKKQILSFARRTFGLWRFEDIDGDNKSAGAFNNKAELKGGAVIAPFGRFGSGLLITGAGYAECGTIPILSRNAGLSVECWISPTVISPLTARTVVNMPELTLILDSDDSVKAAYGSLSFNTAGSILSYERWSHLMLLYEPDYTRSDDRGVLSLYINGVLSGQTLGNPGISIGKRNFYVSHGGAPFKGMIDEVKVTLLVETQTLKLESDITIRQLNGLLFVAPFGIRFDKDGRLVQPVPAMLFNSASTNDSFILAVDDDGLTTVR